MEQLPYFMESFPYHPYNSLDFTPSNTTPPPPKKIEIP
jgi:hypothetical protein